MGSLQQPPKPHDPQAPSITPAELTEKLEQILEKPAVSLTEEAAQLDLAHEVLQQALQ